MVPNGAVLRNAVRLAIARKRDWQSDFCQNLARAFAWPEEIAAKHDFRNFQLLIYSAGQQASIDGDYVAGNKTCSLGGEEHCCAAEFIQLAETMHGRAK